MPYWIITGITKEDFKHQFDMANELCDYDDWGHPINQVADSLTDSISILDSIGARISNGETVEIEVDDNVRSIFASTCDGSLSNEILIEDIKDDTLLLTTKGGWIKTVSYPYFELKK